MTILVHRQENSSFANFGRALACAVCKCALLCVGCSFRFVLFFCHFSSKLSAVSFFFTLGGNGSSSKNPHFYNKGV